MKVYSQRLNSSAVSYAAWDPEIHVLYVQFPSGTCWVYHGVGFEMYHGLVTANSAGNYFNKHIRNCTKFHGQRVFVSQKDLAHAHA